MPRHSVAQYTNADAQTTVKANVKLNELQDPDGAVALATQILDNIGVPANAGDALRKGTRTTTAELPAMTDEKIWKGTGGNVEEVVWPDLVTHAGLPNVHHFAPKVKLETRDMAAAAGDVSYTGYGFQPSSLIAFARAAENIKLSIGSVDPTETQICFFLRGDGSESSAETVFIYMHWSSGGYRCSATITSYDVDGFTLTWSKFETPTGTINMHIFAFK